MVDLFVSSVGPQILTRRAGGEWGTGNDGKVGAAPFLGWSRPRRESGWARALA